MKSGDSIPIFSNQVVNVTGKCPREKARRNQLNNENLVN